MASYLTNAPFAAVLMLGAVVGGCSAEPGLPSSHATRTIPYRLLTHCGIDEARIGSTYYVADHPLSDGHGNPPPDWGDPFQAGTMTLHSPGIAVFRDARGHRVAFRARPGATAYLHICS
jgi:hypothetical protein